ncbi:HAD family hydrolase [Paraconexibacter algicola]|uniref:Haloacid dehalogenase n=1 Tax=Paraconexibacter algicola TaxID=2133960 RepID=A0A2T4UI27_9ACTN|nr:HAD family hydrolase [Paraconexibacter algicola]PTL58890.1 haloacid dehalogenase [Paraconexibacter algicola]
MADVVLFDLDATLIPETTATRAAFLAAATLAAEHHGVDATTLAAAAYRHARRGWASSPAASFCSRIGISASEGLWCAFGGDRPELVVLRDWAPSYQRAPWRDALSDEGVRDEDLVDALAGRFAAARRSGVVPFPDVLPTFDRLDGSFGLGVVTNGASCLQREKLELAALTNRFAFVIASGDLGVGKPDPAIFRAAADRAATVPGRIVMVGDDLDRDVNAARAAGLRAVHLDRAGTLGPPAISTLAELPTALGAIAEGCR